MHKPPILLAGAVVVLTTLALGAPAFAANSDVQTPGWYWHAVEDDASQISDAEAYYKDFMGSGVDLYGFTEDAFDGTLDSFSVEFETDVISPVFVPTSAVYLDNGLTTIVATGIADFGGGNSVQIVRTLRIQGSYAQWTFEFEDGTSDILVDVTARTSGDLGSDSSTTFIPVGANGLVSHDAASGSDPVIGYDFQTGSDFLYDVVDGTEFVDILFTSDSTSTLTIGLLDYDPCSFDTAVERMTALVPNLTSGFGGSIGPAFAPDCLAVGAPVNLGNGAPTNQVLTLTEAVALTDWGYLGSDSPTSLKMFPVNLPAGMALALEFDGSGVPSLRLTGTPPSGTHVVEVLFYLEIVGEGTFVGAPLVSTFTMVLPTLALAATGNESGAATLGAASLLLSGITMMLVTRARRRSVR